MTKSSKKENPHDPLWAQAKRVCRLNADDIRMAKKLGIAPRALMKNNPSKSQKWKQPVKAWIHTLYEKRFGREVLLPVTHDEIDGQSNNVRNPSDQGSIHSQAQVSFEYFATRYDEIGEQDHSRAEIERYLDTPQLSEEEIYRNQDESM